MKKLTLLILLMGLSKTTLAFANKTDTVVCPIDGEKVVFILVNSLNSNSTYMDLEKKGEVGVYYFEIINTCQKCHFSGYIEDFRKPYKPEVFKYIVDYVATLKNRNMDEVSQCEMAAEILANQKADDREVAFAYLLASYRLRNAEVNKEKRKDLQRRVIEYYDKAIENKEFDDKDKATYLYLIGDMHRRVGEFDFALKYYDKAMLEKKKTKWVKEAIEQMKPLAEKKDDRNDI